MVLTSCAIWATKLSHWCLFMTNSIDIGIIGGTGIYDPELFSAKREMKVHTPYGEASDFVTIGEYSGVKAAFVPRHGRGHRIPPHKIKKLKYSLHSEGTYICIEGPRFSTRAESRFFRDVMKADIIGMTLVPEVNLAREAQICYLSIATITDYDVWANHPVTSAEIIETLAKNVEKTKKLIAELVATIPAARNKCACSKTLEGALV